MNVYGGLQIVENSLLESQHFDWSGCRSPSRARRRYRKRGIVGRIKITVKPTAMQVGNVIYAHPRIVAELRKIRDADAPYLWNPNMSGAPF